MDNRKAIALDTPSAFLSRCGSRWTPEEDAIIRRFFPTEGAIGCAKRFRYGRTGSACYSRAVKLGVIIPKREKKEEAK